MQTSSHLDSLIPPHENIPAMLARLSMNIATLTHLIDDAERRKIRFLRAMFDRSRQDKISQALACSSTTGLET